MLAVGPLFLKHNVFLDKCALDSSLKASLRVQPLVREVSKLYKEDLTQRSLQKAATSHSLPRKQKKKSGAKSGEFKVVVNSAEGGQWQIITKPPMSTEGSQ